MATSARKKAAIPYNPDVLRWARERRGISIEDVAEKLKQAPERISAWESASDAPTVIQARKLAEIYERSFLEFFLKSPPQLKEPELVPDFRAHRGIDIDADDRGLLDLQEWAEAQRENALDLFHEVGEQIPQFPDGLYRSTSDDEEDAAKSAREDMGFTIDYQLALKSADRARLPNILRAKIEQIGVLTLKATEIREFGARGICFVKFPLPVIVFGNETPGAQAFTLIHELAHVMLKASAIIAPLSTQTGIESWCDRFAAAFLMPSAAVGRLLGKRPSNPQPSITDTLLESTASALKVSSHAMLVRLVHLGYVHEGYYWRVKKPQFDAQERNFKSFGRSEYYGSRYKNALGDLYTGLVIEAWGSGRITNHNAAEYMGIKNLQHLYDIRERFGGR
ncbi:helix-turn-helix domain-containing protein [Rhizobium leguminosarum bv. viciae]|uniref:XRE family transcriptional regulator n=1 Tax=Rhizobium leguminosarum TaxID=384 RepID=UPI0010395CF8|nr:XRE family transcriptional regulator [Rhizobium leguminosarum]TCB30463.1 helix-turn-helix domain-containing protein [Rhizobium leguminosarum bv. viciae]